VVFSLCAQEHTEKTFLLPQPVRVPTQSMFYDYVTHVMDKEYAVGWDHFQVTRFYWQQENGFDTGRYFGRNKRNVVRVASATTDITAFDPSNFIFSNNPLALTLAGLLKLKPYRRARGFHVSYLKRLSFISEKLFFNIYTPIMRVVQCMGASVSDEVTDTVNGSTVRLLDYFTGTFEQKSGSTKQDALKYAKIPGSAQKSRTGFGDVECTLGYEWGDGYYLRPFVGVVFPTSNKPKGEFLFEPMLGNGKQWGASIGLEAMTVLHETDDTTVDLVASGQLKYFFDNTQKRTLNIRSADWDKIRPWSHYELLGEKGKLGVFPAANVLTRDVNVHQGILYDCYLNLNFRHRRCMINLGYNFFARERESITVKNWPNDTYALASSNYDATQPFTIAANPDPLTDDNVDGPIQKEMLHAFASETPALISHKIYGIVSYVRRSIPLSFGVGGAYEFAQGNAVLEGYELYIKLGLSF
jgi:hypothetical protein